MRLFLDQDVYVLTIRFLRELEHDIVLAADRNMSRSDDSDLLRQAASERRIFVTRDSDFGRLLFADAQLGRGVIFLRTELSHLVATHRELAFVLNEYDEQELLNCFTVVRAGSHRIRKLPHL